MKKALLAIAIGTSLCWLTPVASAGRRSVAQSMADGAVAIARVRLTEDAQSEAGRQLMRFASAVDPNNESALLLQAKLERGLELKSTPLKDGGARYVRNLMGVIRKTSSENRQLLLWKIVEIIDPTNEGALLALTKAKNKGTNTDFETLLAVFQGKPPPAPEPAAEPEPEPEPAGRSPFVVSRRRESEPLEAPPPASNADAAEVVAKGMISVRHWGYSSTSSMLNRISEALAQRDVLLDVHGQKLALRRQETTCNGIRRPYFYSNGDCAIQFRLPESSNNMENMTIRQALGEFCTLHGVAYRCEGSNVFITDPDDPKTAEVLGVVRQADDLLEEFKSNRSKALTRYREKKVFVLGEVSGVGEAMGRTYVHLYHDKIRFYVDPSCEKDAADLKAAYDAVTAFNRDVEREAKRYCFSSNEEREQHILGRQQHLVFSGSGVCRGQSGGRIELKDGLQPSWVRKYKASQR